MSNIESSSIKLQKRHTCPGTRAVQRWLSLHRDLYWLEVSNLPAPIYKGAYLNSPSNLVLSFKITHTDDDAFVALVCGELATHFQATGLDWEHLGDHWAVRIWWR